MPRDRHKGAYGSVSEHPLAPIRRGQAAHHGGHYALPQDAAALPVDEHGGANHQRHGHRPGRRPRPQPQQPPENRHHRG